MARSSQRRLKNSTGLLTWVLIVLAILQVGLMIFDFQKIQLPFRLR